MATRTTPVSPASLQATDRFDATVSQIGFVVRRAPNRDWAIADLVNRRYHILAFAISGRAQYQCAGEAFEVGKGQVLFFPKGVAHSGRSDPKMPWSFFSTTFDLLCFDPQGEGLLPGLPRRSAPANTLEIQALFRELERLWVAREPGFLLRCMVPCPLITGCTIAHPKTLLHARIAPFRVRKHPHFRFRFRWRPSSASAASNSATRSSV